MQDGVPLHIANPVKLLLKRHFGNVRIISHQFHTALASPSPDLNSCDFWLWGYLKDIIFSTLIAHLAKLKAPIVQYILTATLEYCDQL